MISPSTLFLIVAVFFATLSLFSVVDVAASKTLTEYRQEWEMYKLRFNKHYAANSVEDRMRFRIYLSRLPENNARLREIQSENPLAFFGPNPFSDWTEKELDSRRNKKLAARVVKKSSSPSVLDRQLLSNFMSRSAEARSVNWTAKGAVTNVKNQGQCGSCWAFSTAACLEGQNAIINGRRDSLSPQELVSCDTLDYGCDGSDDYSDTEKWIVRHNNGTIDTWESYPYVSGMGTVPKCRDRNDPKRKIGLRFIEGGKVIPSHEDEMARVLVEEGPVQISIDSEVLQNYNGGIIEHAKCRSSNVDHEVLIVGVEENHNPAYWIVKNSWGESWGERGYFRLKKGDNLICVAEWPYIWKIRKE